MKQQYIVRTGYIRITDPEILKEFFELNLENMKKKYSKYSKIHQLNIPKDNHCIIEFIKQEFFVPLCNDFVPSKRILLFNIEITYRKHKLVQELQIAYVMLYQTKVFSQTKILGYRKDIERMTKIKMQILKLQSFSKTYEYKHLFSWS
ncbi:unnamed protein product (macronuclear) [Paramecium tetraurelia]|uniref:Uncharacterized protein n=1 Tax=Paramecium tetraurelia TaxID=5888 RepID=A0C611_PARTE|nr:uncharacterized protein GSPATT00035357001 [Paramecium tetraurelia]CAK66228.1 unnamed protein product [Paramecium tetraurelia]|eukprot:XP_001433625.1 hypothetical protein (macronuclear) [Paramecium tetraurelia strain d4-2]